MEKEKQIEEMAEEIEALFYCKGYADDRGCYFANSCTSCKNANRERAIQIAELLINIGYRKVKRRQTYMLKADGSLEMIPTVESVRAEVVREILGEINSFIDSDKGKAHIEAFGNWFEREKAKTEETIHNIGVESAKNALRDFVEELEKKYIGEKK